MFTFKTICIGSFLGNHFRNFCYECDNILFQIQFLRTTETMIYKVQLQVFLNNENDTWGKFNYPD